MIGYFCGGGGGGIIEIDLPCSLEEE